MTAERHGARTAEVETRARILVVEDSGTQALRLRHFLEEAGFRVDCANTAGNALEKINKVLPDLLITDYHLPGIPGDELCRRIRMNVNTRGLPILMLTSEEAAQVERQGLESGADDYVRKSEDDVILLIRVEVLLRKSRVHAVFEAEQGRFAAARILVVEDSATYRALIARELSRAGFQVETAGAGAEALERLALENFDGVVLDMILPDMDGADICRRFVAARRTLDRSFAILMLTGEERNTEVNAALAAGADDVVGKSRDMEIIMARLRALIRRKLLYEENQRIAREFQERERALLRARAEKEAAEVRAALADQLADANRLLEAANRELRETQVQLVQSAKMASLGQLVAGVAHEINNPLAFVMSHHATVDTGLQAVLADAETKLSGSAGTRLEKIRQRLRDMRLGLDRIRDLIVKLRTFSRLDEGEFKHVDIVECIESVLTLLQHRLKEGIKVTKKYGDVKIVPCYPGPLNQVIMNVLSNAIDAIEGEGEIVISTEQAGPMFSISITDTGRGIPDAIRDRVFDPFFTTKAVGQGTGLGLSISYGIVKKHGGEIEIRSKEGRGTEVIVRIPREQDAGGDPAEFRAG